MIYSFKEIMNAVNRFVIYDSESLCEIHSCVLGHTTFERDIFYEHPIVRRKLYDLIPGLEEAKEEFEAWFIEEDLQSLYKTHRFSAVIAVEKCLVDLREKYSIPSYIEIGDNNE